jgi:acyl dehydratase
LWKADEDDLSSRNVAVKKRRFPNMVETDKKKVTVPEFQKAAITDEMIEKAQTLMGMWTRRENLQTVSEPISQLDVRKWAIYSVGDDNPLWTDSDYARKTIWGRTIVPPTFLFCLEDPAMGSPGFPGIQGVYWGSRWELFKPVRVGDQITMRKRFTRMSERSGKHASRFIVQTQETMYVNQVEQVVGRIEEDIARIPRGGSGRMKFEKKEKERTKYTAEEIEHIRQAYLTEERRGSLVRYWEEVKEGDIIPTIVKGPLTLVDIMAFYSGRRTVYNPLKIAFLERERHPKNVYVSPETGIPVHPAAGHFDPEIAHEIGMPGTYDQGWMRHNWMAHLLTNWASDWGFVRKLNVSLRLPNQVGDVTWVKGVVKRVFTDGQEHLVEIECWGENQRGEKNMEGSGVVRLPSKAPEDKYTF